MCVCVFKCFLRIIKNDKISQDATCVCSVMLDAGMQRQNIPYIQVKKSRQSRNMNFWAERAEFVAMNGIKTANVHKAIWNFSVETIEKMHDIMRDRLIYLITKLLALTISELGTQGHPQGR